MIKREACVKAVRAALARNFLPEDPVNNFDQEDPASLVHLNEPVSALRSLKGLAVIDEVQRRPDLFPMLRVLVYRRIFGDEQDSQGKAISSFLVDF